MHTTTMAQAMNTALRDAMRDNERVVVFGDGIFGEDTGRLGSALPVTGGLATEFGEQQCFEAFPAEAGILGTAVGMAVCGYRPVVEIPFDAKAYPAFEQIVGQVATLRSRTRRRIGLPIVIRVPYGSGHGGLEHHNYVQTPGLHVVAPATVADAYSLLRQAIDSPDPVVFLEPQCLYSTTDQVRLPTQTPPFGQAVIRRPGTHTTLIAYGPAVHTALAAAEAAHRRGLDLEVIDLRTLVPFDDATITDSVTRTGHAVVIHEPHGFAGIGAEIAARVTEHCSPYLEAPVRRVTGLDIPYPPAKLAKYYLTSVNRILNIVTRLQLEVA